MQRSVSTSHVVRPESAGYSGIERPAKGEKAESSSFQKLCAVKSRQLDIAHGFSQEELRKMHVSRQQHQARVDHEALESEMRLGHDAEHSSVRENVRTASLASGAPPCIPNALKS
jgi:hypothetical protein